MPNEVRRMRWGANHRDTPSRLRSFSGSRARHCPYFSQSQRKAPTEAPHFHSPTATARCHLISRSRDSFPSRGSLWPRQKVVSPLKAKRRRRANAFPLRGRCRTDVRRMRWGANHRCNPIAAMRLRLTKRIPVFYTLPTAPKNVPQTDGFGQSAAVRVLPFSDFMIQ